MKQQGFSPIWFLVLILVIGLGGGAWWYISQEDDTDSSDATTEQISTEIEEPVVADNNTVPDGWRLYQNEVLRVQFIYPEQWGEVIETDFDGQGKTEHYGFTNLDSFSFGGHRIDYEFLPRSGSLIDTSGFRMSQQEEHVYTDLSGNDTGPVGDGYTLTDNGNCLINTDVDFFGDSAYHAVCNTVSEVVPGFNFAVYDTAVVEEAVFVEVVESVEVLEG